MKWLGKILTVHYCITFLVMGFSALSFGLLSHNLFMLFGANIDYISNNGVMALKDGGLEQFLSLCGYGFICLSLYVIFKACEKAMVEHILKK